MEKDVNGLLPQLEEIVEKAIQEYKSLIGYDIDLFIEKHTLLTGSKAKMYYGFELHKCTNPNLFRDTDRVLKVEHKKLSKNAKKIFRILTDISQPLAIVYGQSWSEENINFEPNTDKFTPALYQFVWKKEFIEVFDHVEGVEVNRHNRKYVSLGTLIRCAREWGREKDLFFLEQVKKELQ